MQTKKTKPLKVTDDQQKAWDLITSHAGKITSILVSLITLSFWIGWYIKGISDNSKQNELVLKFSKEIEDIRRIESENCKENIKNYKELVDRFIHNNDNKDEK